MNQNDGPASAFDHEMKTRAINGNEFREGFGILMSNARSDVCSFESAGYIHKSLSGEGPESNPQITQITPVSAVKREMLIAHDRTMIS